MHWDEPTLEYNPLLHAVQTDAPAALNVPAAHCVAPANEPPIQEDPAGQGVIWAMYRFPKQYDPDGALHGLGQFTEPSEVDI